MVNVNVHTTIPSEWKDEIDKNHWKINEILGLGLQAKKENPQLLIRLHELDYKVEKMARLLAIQANRSQKLEIMYIEKGIGLPPDYPAGEVKEDG